MKNIVKVKLDEYLKENNNNDSSKTLDDYIKINDIEYSTRNSNGDFISTNIDYIINFYKWFNNSVTLDDKKRPIVYYHISNNVFNVFKPSMFGKMGAGIYFTSIFSDIQQHNKYNDSIIYKCYLKIKNPLEIEHPFSKRYDNNDGIIAFKGKSGEEIKVYESKQIKSIENDGSFDSNDDNIYS